jgi:hypothetical protein
MVLVAQAAIAATPERWQKITRLVEKIKNESSAKERGEEVERLASLVEKRAREAVPESVVADLTSLMSHRDDHVRYWTAMALGYLGPQAASSIPALENALKEVDNVHTSKTSASGIRVALARIRGTKK